MKLRSCIVLLCLIALASAQDLTKQITYRTAAVPLHTALDEISKQGHVTLSASDELADEPIILVLRAKPLADVMARIASTMDARWEKTKDGGFVLGRTPEMVAKLQKDQVAERAAEIKKGIDLYVKGSKIDEDWNPASIAILAKSYTGAIKLYAEDEKQYATLFIMEARTPADRALARFLKLIPPETFAKLDRDQQVCFSTDPNSMQLPIPGDWKKVLDELKDEQNTFADAFRKEFPSARSEKPVATYYWSQASRQLAEAPLKAVLKISFQDETPSITMIIPLKDSSNGGRIQAGTALESRTSADRSAEYAASVARAKTEQEIPLSRETRTVEAVCQAVNRQFMNPPPLSPEAKRIMLDPANHDPLSFFMSDGFLALADSQNANLVAYVPDSLIRCNRGAAAIRFTLSSFAFMLSDVNQKSDGDWLEVSPKEPLEALRTRCDRELFGEILREGDKQGYISIANAARLALADREPAEPPFVWTMAQFGSQYAAFLDRDPRLLRFYGSLDDGQRKTLGDGGVLMAGGLNQQQYDQLQDYVQQTSAVHPPPGVYDPALPTEIPSEVVRGDVPMDTAITMSDAVGDTVFVDATVTDTNYQIDWDALFTNLDDLAVSLVYAGSEANQSFHVNWFAPGLVHNLTLAFSHPKDWQGEGLLAEKTMGTTRYPFDHLPADLKAKFDEARTAAQEMYARQYPAAQTGGGAKPPLH